MVIVKGTLGEIQQGNLKKVIMGNSITINNSSVMAFIVITDCCFISRVCQSSYILMRHNTF